MKGNKLFFKKVPKSLPEYNELGKIQGIIIKGMQNRKKFPGHISTDINYVYKRGCFSKDRAPCVLRTEKTIFYEDNALEHLIKSIRSIRTTKHKYSGFLSYGYNAHLERLGLVLIVPSGFVVFL